MDAQEVIAAAEQAALSALDQVSSHAHSTASNRATTAGNGGMQRKNDTSKAEDKSSAKEATIDLSNDDHDEADEDDSYIPEDDAGEMSFVIDTAGDMDVDRGIALEDEAKAEHPETHVEAGLLLPAHVNVIPQAETSASGTNSALVSPYEAEDTPNGDEDFEGDLGDFEQLDMVPSTANRYYGAEEKAERRAKEQCLACGELGHDRRHCPHQHCLACGAMDEHPTRFCPLSTSCFRCGGMGHQTRTCPKPRRGPKSEECERCGSYSHVKALCPTLWRVYTYSTVEKHERHRAKVFFKLSKGSSARDPRRDVEPDPEELIDSEDEFARAGEPEAPAANFDPATRWCYNCSGSGNHWGDDCPEARVNPTRGTGEPSAFSEFVSRLGPFAKNLPGAPPVAGYQMPFSQFTFSVGSSATMHVTGDAAPSSSSRNANSINTPRRGGQSSRDNGSRGLAIGSHFLAFRDSSRTSSPHPAPSSSRSRGTDQDEELVSFDRSKVLRCDGGFLTRKEKKKGKKPLPEHLFRQWLKDRQAHPDHTDEIRNALEKRADLEAKGLSTDDVPTTSDIVGSSRGKKGKASKDVRPSDRDSDRPTKRRRGDLEDNPVIIRDDDDDSSYRDDYSSDSSSDSDTRAKRGRRGGKKGRKIRADTRGQPPPHTGWGHNGNGGGPKRGKFSTQRKGGNDKHRDGGSDRPKPKANGGDSSGKKKRSRGGGNKGKNGSSGSGSGGGGGGVGRGGGGGGDKIRGGGSKYRGGYF